MEERKRLEEEIKAKVKSEIEETLKLEMQLEMETNIKLQAEENIKKEESMRVEIEKELRLKIERDLREQIESEAKIEVEEIRNKAEKDLAKFESELKAKLETELREEIEKDIRAQSDKIESGLTESKEITDTENMNMRAEIESLSKENEELKKSLEEIKTSETMICKKENNGTDIVKQIKDEVKCMEGIKQEITNLRTIFTSSGSSISQYISKIIKELKDKCQAQLKAMEDKAIVYETLYFTSLRNSIEENTNLNMQIEELKEQLEAKDKEIEALKNK